MRESEKEESVNSRAKEWFCLATIPKPVSRLNSSAERAYEYANVVQIEWLYIKLSDKKLLIYVFEPFTS